MHSLRREVPAFYQTKISFTIIRQRRFYRLLRQLLREVADGSIAWRHLPSSFTTPPTQIMTPGEMSCLNITGNALTYTHSFDELATPQRFLQTHTLKDQVIIIVTL